MSKAEKDPLPDEFFVGVGCECWKRIDWDNYVSTECIFGPEKPCLCGQKKGYWHRFKRDPEAVKKQRRLRVEQAEEDLQRAREELAKVTNS
jgi:hypothetical protein